jgi:hypothetical protein
MTVSSALLPVMMIGAHFDEKEGSQQTTLSGTGTFETITNATSSRGIMRVVLKLAF